MGRKVGFGGLVVISIGAALIATILITLLVEATGNIDSGLLFFAYVLGTIGISTFAAIALYDRVLKEKISWGY
jgi:hypothetical protein